MGRAYTYMGSTSKASEFLYKALYLATEENNPDVTVIILNNIGDLYIFSKMYKDALSYYQEALLLAQSNGDDLWAAKESVNMAIAYILSHDYEEALEPLKAAFNTYKKIRSDSHEKVYGLISIGKAYHYISHYHLTKTTQELKLYAFKALHKAGIISETLSDFRSHSYALGYLGKLYEDENRYEEALRLTRQAVFSAQKINAAGSLYQWQWQTGRILKEKGETDKAILPYQDAVKTLQSIRREMTAQCERYHNISFKTSMEPLYYELADLLLQHSAILKDPDKISKYLRQARETIELLKSAELEDYFFDPCVSAYYKKSVHLEELTKEVRKPDTDDKESEDIFLSKGMDIQDITAQTAVIYIIPFRNRIELLLSYGHVIKRFTTFKGAKELAQTARNLRKYLEELNKPLLYRAPAQDLYKWLIKPLENELNEQKIDTLVFVPDKSLRIIPMAALYDGSDFLINKFALAVTQGLILTDPHRIEKQRKVKMLLSGLTKSVPGFKALKYVDNEVKGIKRLYKEAVVLMDQDFVSKAIKKELEETPYTIVHIASHGSFSKDARENFILTWDGKMYLDDLSKFIKPTRFRLEPVQLLTLSACETASASGDEERAALGIAGIAVKAGAKSALATLWNINDKASSQIIVEFYRQLQNNKVSKAKALQQAQLMFIKNNQYKNHPLFWSPFLLIGNWL
jgi:CHAT domain-containing protein